MIEIQHERMSDEFEKFHLSNLPFGAALHHFTGTDKGGPHDHPWAFTTYILKGGYTEKVYTILPDGTWQTSLESRFQGNVYSFTAQHIHEIVHLPESGCWTLVIPEPWERQSRFWRFEKHRICWRLWHESELELKIYQP